MLETGSRAVPSSTLHPVESSAGIPPESIPRVMVDGFTWICGWVLFHTL